MSHVTKPIFVHYGQIDDHFRSHPALNFLAKYRDLVDSQYWKKGVPASEWHTADFRLQKTDGTVVKGAEEAVKAIGEIYAPFTGHKHDPDFIVVWETEDGWESIGTIQLFFNLPGLPGSAVIDPQGEKWDGVAPGASQFWYAKEDGGIKLKGLTILADPTPGLKIMLQNKLINAEQLAGIVIGS